MDRSLKGTVDRISPEAPVPILDIKERSQTPGGAGNVVSNLAALGAHPTLVSVRGNDSAGEQLVTELKFRGVNLNGVLIDSNRPTITKTRVVAGQQQIVRLDQEKRGPLAAATLQQVLKKIKTLLPSHKGVILSDYGKGVVTPPVIKTVIREAHRKKAFVMVDPKIEHFFQYRGVDCLTPNTKESVEGMRALPPKSEEELVALGWKIVKKLNSRSLLVTRGEKGMMLFEKGGKVRSIPTRAKEVFDVTGAGDTVIATFALARAVGAPYYEAAQIANCAASVVVAKLGTAVITQEELIRAIENIR